MPDMLIPELLAAGIPVIVGDIAMALSVLIAAVMLIESMVQSTVDFARSVKTAFKKTRRRRY